MNKKRFPLALLSLFAVLSVASVPVALAARKAAAGKMTRDEFFIVAEVNLKRQRLILELPTQITMVMHMNGKTVFENKQGHRLPLSQIRAGDTVFVTYQREAGGGLALLIRLGPMTVGMLHRRYWNG
jgi:hypothetical protein